MGSILLVGVFIRHDTAWSLPGYSPQAWFYVLGGFWEMLLCLMILTMVTEPLAIAALWIGILEGAQIAVCRLATTGPIGKGNLCDNLTGLPIGATMVALYLLIIAVQIGKSWRSASRSRASSS